MRDKIQNEVVQAVAGTKDLTEAIDSIIEIANQKQRDNVAIQVHGMPLNRNKFEKLARPMIKFLCEEYHPNVAVIITPTSAELLGSLNNIGIIEDYIL